jgi:hypothetical protein
LALGKIKYGISTIRNTPVTLRERRQRVAALKYRVRSARMRLNAALRTMDYGVALACQVEIDDLQNQVHLLERQHRHDPYPT